MANRFFLSAHLWDLGLRPPAGRVGDGYAYEAAIAGLTIAGDGSAGAGVGFAGESSPGIFLIFLKNV